MSKRIYVGNLPFSATNDEVTDLFSEYGEVESVHLVTDRDTGRPRGFGFVEMTSGGDEAIEALNQYDMGGRSLKVVHQLDQLVVQPHPITEWRQPLRCQSQSPGVAVDAHQRGLRPALQEGFSVPPETQRDVDINTPGMTRPEL